MICPSLHGKMNKTEARAGRREADVYNERGQDRGTEKTAVMEKYWDKYKDIILYLIFGGLTTAVNIAVYWVSVHVLGTGVMFGTVAAWVLAVLFAYLTNRELVFHSSASGGREILKEIGSFFACRLGTGVMDWVIMFVFVTVLHFDDMVIKILSNIIVIVLNFILSKFVIFKK